MIAADGAYFGSFGFAGDASTVGALSGDLRSVLVDDAVGRVYVVDAIQSQIEVYTLGGVPLFHFGEQGTGPGQLRGPRQLTLSGDGNICVTEYGGYRIQRFDVDGNPGRRSRRRPRSRRPVSSDSRATSRSTRRPGTCGSRTHGTSGSRSTRRRARSSAHGGSVGARRRTD